MEVPSLFRSGQSLISAEGKRGTDEDGGILLQSILHIMGEYFKGYAADDSSVVGRSLHKNMEIPEIFSGMTQVAENTFNIVDKETRKILEVRDSLMLTHAHSSPRAEQESFS